MAGSEAIMRGERVRGLYDFGAARMGASNRTNRQNPAAHPANAAPKVRRTATSAAVRA
jgi:hypothetical protein